MKTIKSALVLFIVAIGLVVAVSGCGKTTKSDAITTAVDSSPDGTWVNGDPNSVYNKLVIYSSGTFSFQTVDFTGEVKGGYSGTWSMSGNSVRFEWGSGGADSGSCSGSRTGSDSIVFGGTTFYSNFQNAPQATSTDYPIETNFAALIYSESITQIDEKRDSTLKNLLTQNAWIGTNSSGTTLLLNCSDPYRAENGWTFFKHLEITETNGKSIFPSTPSDMQPFTEENSPGNFVTVTQEQIPEHFRPQLGIINGEISDWHFTFLIYHDFVAGKVDPRYLPYSEDEVKGRFVNTNFMIIEFPKTTFGRMFFTPKPN